MDDENPLLTWLKEKGLNTDEGREKFASSLETKRTPTGESIRHIAYDHRRAAWDLCFDIEKATGVEGMAHALRDRWKSKRKLKLKLRQKSAA